MNTSITIDQVMAYLCSLILDCGKPNPTEAEAEQYSKTERSLVTPRIAMRVLDAIDWQDCLKIYHKRINNDTNEHRTGIRYTRKELVEVLNELWKEFDGNITQNKIIERAKKKPTPGWNTLIRHFGQPSAWAQFLDPAVLEECPPPADKIKIEIRITLPGQSQPIVFEINQK